MTHIAIETREVRAQFMKSDKNQPLIEFFDPSYARAEIILYDHKTHDLHAILHEGQFKIGRIPENLESLFDSSDSVLLCADHYSGHKVGLTAKLAHI